ncbi:SF1B family DNA helicase RecD2 [Desulfosoma caldarium]|uniref:Exodeoxyribonuclease V alpha subunit n=1 Tax=Desulfosoma caldarium TaxID=610254 RepID=A0A3N1UTW7_9BACT|nr:ATP-dependent RecD-like DNA helicase [Desulfosoma caldarium]ROQ93603.1 exodeoxyribonuclease V alpha subunit [Desulfosoma caldarium]
MAAEILEGQVERVTYAGEEDGYSVLRLRVRGRRDLVTVVGSFVSVTPGEVLRLHGFWRRHPKYGPQFRVDQYEILRPDTVQGICKYLGSGLIKGIGPEMAKRIVKVFGAATLEVIDQKPERLLEVEGIGPKRLSGIVKAWDDQKEIREVMIFLKTHGVSASHATRIFKQYGKDSLTVLQENPYRLAMDVSGIGFVTADKIARSLGFDRDSVRRAQAGLHYVLFKAADDGHVCLPRAQLLRDAEKLLETSVQVLEQGLQALAADGRVILEPLSDAVARAVADTEVVYLRGYHVAETQTAARLTTIGAWPKRFPSASLDKVLSAVTSQLPFPLAPLQMEAIRKALTEKVMVITGGPGTGKTTLVRAICAAYKRMGARVALAAPTGRAAKRLSETTGQEAATVHRLLEFSPAAGGFQRNEQKPLTADCLIVDEASMLDALLAHHLLKAVSSRTTVIFVGDVDQLPSVGAGNVLKDIIASEAFSVVRLTEIFRQAQKSLIVVNAHRIREGSFPIYGSTQGERLSDFYFIEKDDPEDVLRLVVELCSRRIPGRFHLDPVEDIQVLSPMHRGVVGAQHLNEVLQKALNPRGRAVERAGRIYRVGDKVMQLRNNYDKEVFNGDMGRIDAVDEENQEIRVRMDGRLVSYDFSELDEITHAYAVSVHKSQGSEYPAVVIPLVTQHYVMLQRNLLYTAVTRGRKLVVLLGSRKALAMAVRNDRLQKRYTLLAHRLAARTPPSVSV